MYYKHNARESKHPKLINVNKTDQILFEVSIQVISNWFGLCWAHVGLGHLKYGSNSVESDQFRVINLDPKF